MKKFLLQSVFFIKSSTKLCTEIATYGQKMTKHSWTHLPRQQRDKNINERREIQKRPTILNVERQRGRSHVAPDISIDHPENCPIRMRALNLLYSRFSPFFSFEKTEQGRDLSEKSFVLHNSRGFDIPRWQLLSSTGLQVLELVLQRLVASSTQLSLMVSS